MILKSAKRYKGAETSRIGPALPKANIAEKCLSIKICVIKFEKKKSIQINSVRTQIKLKNYFVSWMSFKSCRAYPLRFPLHYTALGFTRLRSAMTQFDSPYTPNSTPAFTTCPTHLALNQVFQGTLVKMTRIY